MADIHSILCVVAGDGVVDVDIQRRAWRCPHAVAVAACALRIAARYRVDVGVGPFLIAAGKLNDGVEEIPGRVVDAGVCGAVVEVPSGHAVVADAHALGGDRPADGANDSTIGEPMHPHILKQNVVEAGGSGDAVNGIVVCGEGTISTA